MDMTVEAGDIVATGTPAGVGYTRNPPLFLKPGDIMEASIEGIGTLRNTVTI
jgi:2-keto-4-pentenoate hydratase/2-oxohepta-3-ene-1,7-dioic acid hydratase in catechol pathway